LTVASRIDVYALHPLFEASQIILTFSFDIILLTLQRDDEDSN
jgi:hypothetical protein